MLIWKVLKKLHKDPSKVFCVTEAPEHRIGYIGDLLCWLPDENNKNTSTPFTIYDGRLDSGIVDNASVDWSEVKRRTE